MFQSHFQILSPERRFPRLRFTALALMAASALAVQTIGMQPVIAESNSRPNIVLMMADDQGWGDVAYNGHPAIKTPTLDAMAAGNLRFDRFYAAAPVCSPTRGSVLTGRHPNRFGCFRWGYTLRPQEVTVAEALGQAGYATGHFGKWHVGPVRAESPVSPGNSGFDEWFSSPNFYENDPLMSHNGKVVETQGESSEVTVDAALEFIQSASGRGQPFLAVVWFGSPHTPHIASEEIRRLYEDHPKRLQHYYGEVTGIDRAVKKLRDALRSLEIADNTLVWYTSDNGARKPGSTGGLRGQKGSMWEGGLRVPAIIEWPARIQSHRVIDVPCSTVDIYPTVLELAGAAVPDQPEPLDGESLAPLIDEKKTSRSKPLGFWDYPAKGHPVRSTELLKALQQEQQTGVAASEEVVELWKITKQYAEDDRAGHAAWIDGAYKLHRISRRGGGVDYQLYNLVDDREERQDLAGQEPERVRRMRAELEAWQASVIRSLNGEDYR